VTARPAGRDRRLEAAVRARLDRDPSSQVSALARYEVAVLDGRATLAGHVRSRDVARRMAALAGQVRGLDAVEDRLVEDHVGRGELALQLLHGSWTDDRRRDGGVVEHEGDRELDERDPGLFGELREFFDGIELALVAGLGEVEALGQPAGARGGLRA
jgi:hypothetical protein